MDKKERLLQVFIEEANEIIEQLDRLVMELEEGGDGTSLINDIFRGVHTLKGSANSFGFTRLGEYVHHWEDLLGMFRDHPEFSLDSSMDLFFEAVTVVREMLDSEINKIDGYPENYTKTLDEIKQKIENSGSLLEADSDDKKESKPVKEEPQFELTYQIANINDLELKAFAEDEKKQIKKSIDDGKNLYNIVLCFDDDLYFRGHNHLISIKLLDDIGDIVKSYWSFNALDSLDEYNNEHNYIKEISLYLITDLTHIDIEEIFEFSADDHEVKIRLFSKDETLNIVSKQNSIEEKKPEKKEANEIENKRREGDRRQGDRRTGDRGVTKTQSFIRIESGKIDELFNSVGEMVIAQSYIENSEVIQASDNVALKKNINALSKSTKRIQDQVMSLRMVAIKDTFLKMKRIARDVSKKTGKEFEFIINGEDTEIDKTMVDALSDPLIHLIRNAIDHGLESDEDRKKAGKGVGQVYLEAYHRGDNIVIEITDDGKGIDTQAILDKAIERGLAHQGQDLSESEIISFIFNPGFSMAKEISDVSGRGVGLDVVKTSIDKLKGKMDISTTLGKGSSFKIVLPLTLAIIDGMIISINDETFIIPTLTVVESFSPNMDKVSSVQHKEEFIDFRGEVLPIVHLNRFLQLDGEERADKDSVFICIEHEKGKFVLRVDSLLGRQQVVVKSMGKFLNFVKEIVGGAILGDGKIALILNIEDIRAKLDI
ncbi:MAG: chemotaxis protein CheA [Arcobacteraceae bacterium]|nr:chemotaxis protein CheA [Arcobacteraceae bacterium]